MNQRRVQGLKKLKIEPGSFQTIHDKSPQPSQSEDNDL